MLRSDRVSLSSPAFTNRFSIYVLCPNCRLAGLLYKVTQEPTYMRGEDRHLQLPIATHKLLDVYIA